MLLYFIRHGETEWNTAGKLQGESDIPLNEKGKMLAKLTGEALKDVLFDTLILSPFIRTIQTAEFILRGRKIPTYRDNRIREIEWGEWDGMTADELDVAGYRETYNLFYTDPFQFPGAPGGETVRQVCDRGKAFLEDITGRPENAQKRILIVTHGCAVRGILNHLYDNPADFWQGDVPPNCSLNLVHVGEGGIRLLEKDKIFYDPDLVENHYKMQ
ncbi:MAG TPA: histidine phosphatase family protein [Candidatus Mediterraneibacter vanvlietii]|nr:histidine phosphatase family protein [Candidatus Mediterraneibacter vanvlietii]